MIIGTRGSDLALTQSGWVRECLAAQGVHARLQVVRTQGDRRPQETFDKLEGKGFFTSELEAALVAGTIDVAVHSLKDLPTVMSPGLAIAAVAGREDPRDTLVVRASRHRPLAAELPLAPGARVGTSSIRRRRLLESLRPDLEVVPIRGNLGTRLARLASEQLDAVVLAQAGLSRLKLDVGDARAMLLPPAIFVPSPAQGALAVQCRAGDAQVAAQFAGLHDAEAAAACDAEREVLQRLGGGCHAPLGAYARRQGNADAVAAGDPPPDRRADGSGGGGNGAGSWRLDVFWQATREAPAERLVVLADGPDGLAAQALARLLPAAARG